MYGAKDDRVLDLRKQIALLVLGTGRRAEARARLADVERLRGTADAELRELLRTAGS